MASRHQIPATAISSAENSRPATSPTATCRTRTIDVIDEAGAAQRIPPKSKQKKVINKTGHRGDRRQDRPHPVAARHHDDRGALKNLDRDLKAVVFGQDKAIDALAKAIKMARSGLGNPASRSAPSCSAARPASARPRWPGSSPTAWASNCIRFDMSEYMERHAVSPPDRRARVMSVRSGGLLTEGNHQEAPLRAAARRNRKAHPDIFNILLQVMDHGTLTDNNGRKADFRNVVIIMTTNAGAADLQKSSNRFHQYQANRRRDGGNQALFHAGFRNRLDATISFGALTTRSSCASSTKFLMQLEEEQLHEKKSGSALHPSLEGNAGREGLRPADGRPPDGHA